MFSSRENSTDLDFRLLLPEIIMLEPDKSTELRSSNHRTKSEADQWQIHLNTLALSAFQEWLSERMSQQVIVQDSHITKSRCQLNINGFILGLIVTEHVLDEVVSIPTTNLEEQDEVAHFYVVLEVIEEQQVAVIRGFINHAELVDYCCQGESPLSQDHCYQIPLSLLDSESNHLLCYCRHLKPQTISISTTSPDDKHSSLGAIVESNRAKLSQWLLGQLNANWADIHTFFNSQTNLAWSTRRASAEMMGVKMFTFHTASKDINLPMVITVASDNSEKIKVQAKLLSAQGKKYLLPRIKLTLYSSTNNVLQVIESGAKDNYIQLKPFYGKEGISFSLEVSFEGIKIREDFEL